MAAPTWNTVHIFGYGEVQIIGKGSNKKVQGTTLTTLASMVNEIYSHKPDSYTGSSGYRVITLVNGQFADWCDQYIVTSPQVNPQTFRIPFSTINETILNTFIGELEKATPDTTNR